MTVEIKQILYLYFYLFIFLQIFKKIWVILRVVFLDALVTQSPELYNQGSDKHHLYTFMTFVILQSADRNTGALKQQERERTRQNETFRFFFIIAGSSINTLLFISAVHDSISIQIPASPLHLNDKPMEADHLRGAHTAEIGAKDKV